MGYPRATCQSCLSRYTGWGLAQREKCDCGGKLVIDFPYNYLIGYLRAGGRNKKQEGLEERGDDDKGRE